MLPVDQPVLLRIDANPRQWMLSGQAVCTFDPRKDQRYRHLVTLLPLSPGYHHLPTVTLQGSTDKSVLKGMSAVECWASDYCAIYGFCGEEITILSPSAAIAAYRGQQVVVMHATRNQPPLFAVPATQ
jgi:hypothetical protein